MYLIKKIVFASVLFILIAFNIQALADSNVYYDISKLADYDSTVDTTAERLSVSYLPKNGNKIVKSGSSLTVDRSVDNSIDCFAEFVMPDRFANEKQFVIDFVFNPQEINTTLRIFRANSTISGISYDFVSIKSGTTTPARLTIMGSSEAINLPSGDTRISLCINLEQKTANVYVGDLVMENISLNIIDNLCIRSFWLGTNSGGGNTKFTVKDAGIYSGPPTQKATHT